MSLINLAIGLVIFGFLIWLANTFIPKPWSNFVIAAIILLAILWLVQAFGITGPTINLGSGG